MPRFTLIIGDLAFVVMQSLYMGVGIRSSNSFSRILMMIIPTFLLWIAVSRVFHLYVFEDISQPAFYDHSGVVQWRPFLSALWQMQKPFRLSLVWMICSLFASLWQSVCWEHIFRTDQSISLKNLLFFAFIAGLFLIVWRITWCLTVILLNLANYSKTARILEIAVISIFVVLQIPSLVLTIKYSTQKKSVESELPYQIAVVFGAGVYSNGQPSKILVDRVNTAADLYARGKITSILMSGDNTNESHNETNVMTKLALERSVPAAAIMQDNTGFDTFSTCQHIRSFVPSEKVILVTQKYHTARALFICERQGIDAVSVFADRSAYNRVDWLFWYIRDWIGLTTAFWKSKAEI